MKTLAVLPSFLVAILAWVVAVIDFVLAKVSDARRPYLVPRRTFFAVYRTSRSYLTGQPMNLTTFRIREYPRHKCF